MSTEDILRARLANQVIANIGELENSAAKTEQASLLRQQLRSNQNINKYDSDSDNGVSNSNLEEKKALVYKNNRLKSELDFYKALLSKPMYEIANHDENFKNTYDLQQALLADWMVSQKAFKELAINFGLKLGIKKEEILRQGNNGELAVLNNENNPENNTNANDAEFINKHAESLKAKLKQQ